MKKFKEFKTDDQVKVIAKVTGYAQFLVQKNDPNKKLERFHVNRVTDWLWNKNIEINPKTNMIEHAQTEEMLKACFNQEENKM